MFFSSKGITVEYARANALLEYLVQYFERLMPTEEPLEPSLLALVRVLARALATEMVAQDLGEAALTRTVEPYQRLLKTWTREAVTHLQAPTRRRREDT